ncbi:hypothetical protein Ntsu_16200 [Nocardia sp. IFM 10818]
MTAPRPDLLTAALPGTVHDTGSLAAHADHELALIDLLDRVLAGGVVISGDITLSIAGVDLVHISLRTLISSVASLLEQ